MIPYDNPRFIASGHDPIGGSWNLSILDGPNGLMLWVRSELTDGGAGTVAALDGRIFGLLAYGPFGDPPPSALEIDGIVTSRAWSVQAELAGGSRLDAHLARIPDAIAPELSAFIVFVARGQRPIAVKAFDQTGKELGRQGLTNVPGGWSNG